MEPKLNLIFFNLFGQKYVKKFKFLDIIRDIEIDNIQLPLPEKVWKHGKDKAVVNLYIYDNNGKTYDYKFNVYYGKNNAYVRTDNISKNVSEIILKNMDDIKVKVGDKELTELDDLENKDRKRLTLINYGFDDININGKDFNLHKIISQNTEEYECLYNQISIQDFENNKFIIQPIIDIIEYDVDFLIKNKNELITFDKKFDDLMKYNDSIYKEHEEEITKQFLKIKDAKSLDLNRDKNYLKEIFNNNDFDLNLFWNYSLCIFFLDNTKEISENKKEINKIISLLKKLKNEIDKINEEKLPLYEKIRVVHTSFSIIFFGQNNILSINEINKLNIKYLIIDEKKNNSIIDRCYNFYENFVNSISEKNDIFPYLINIDSGFGFYEKDIIYTFDLKNLKMIKSHLMEVFPKVIILCNIEKGQKALTDSLTGGIILNEYYLPEYKNFEYNQSNLLNITNVITENQKDDIAMSIFLFLIHEASGHKKYARCEKGYNSPKKIFNKNNKLIELKYKYNYIPNDDNNEYILESNINKFKGDSGHYLELSYGKYKNNELIISLLRDMYNKGKLIKTPNLFTDQIEKLKDYVSLRMQINENKINFDFSTEIPIEKEIDLMRNKIKRIKSENNKIEISNDLSPTKIEKNEYVGKGKRKRSDNQENDISENNKKIKYAYQLKYPNFCGNSKEEKNNKLNNTENNETTNINCCSLSEKIKIKAERIAKEFNIRLDPSLKKSLEKLHRELSIDHPYFQDVAFLLRYQYMKF